MKKLYYIFLILCSTNVFAQKEALTDSAKNAYAASEFEQAVQYYESILETGFESAELYFNLGNAYYKANKLTDAIINYERALLLDPGDEDIQFNLDVARNYVVDKIEVLPRLFIYDWIDSIINLFSSDTWAKISVVSFIFLLIFFLFYFFTNKVSIKKKVLKIFFR